MKSETDPRVHCSQWFFTFFYSDLPVQNSKSVTDIKKWCKICRRRIARDLCPAAAAMWVWWTKPQAQQDILTLCLEHKNVLAEKCKYRFLRNRQYHFYRCLRQYNSHLKLFWCAAIHAVLFYLGYIKTQASVITMLSFPHLKNPNQPAIQPTSHPTNQPCNQPTNQKTVFHTVVFIWEDCCTE